MGAIQNSINSVLGTATVLAAGGKKLKTDAEALAEAKADKSVELARKLPDLEEEIGAQENAAIDASAALDNTKRKYQPELDRIEKAEKKGFTKGPKGQQRELQAEWRREEIGIEIQERKKAMETA